MLIHIELTPDQAAALSRLCDKFAHSDAQGYLYPHRPAAVRSEQAYQMVEATSCVQRALADAGVNAWPWIETGSAT